MRSDHWNFLANLLGAPGAADPPKEKKQKQQDASAAETPAPQPKEEPAVAEDSASEPPAAADDADEVPAAPQAELGQSQAAAGGETADDTDDILEALTSVQPPPKLPGFGVEREEEEGPEASASGDLERPGKSERSGKSERPSKGDRAGKSERRRPEAEPARGRRSEQPPQGGGFASGLGGDLGAEEAESAEQPAEAQASGRRRRASGSGRSTREEPRAERPSRDQRGEASPRRGAESDEESSESRRPSRGRRPRRGVRQRISEEEAARLDAGEPLRRDALTGDADGEEETGGTRRRRRSELEPRSETADQGETDDQQEDFAGGLLESGDDAEAEQRELSRQPKRRSRRGGRGRRRSEPQVDTAEETPQGRDKSKTPGDDLPASAFDDDHEDDDEVEVIRRGRRRGSRGGRGRSEANGQDDTETGATRSSRGSSRGGDGDDSAGERSRRSDVPTWIDTVELFVNANIEHHKKAGRGGRGRGGRRR